MHVGTRPPSDEGLATLLQRLSRQEVTYVDVGATANATLPSGYRHQRRSVQLGHGEDVFRRGQEALRRWEAHRHAGATVAPAGAPLDIGTDVVIVFHFGPLFGLVPVRIVSVADESDRFGFAYGTLPGHPERGEEAFHVNRHPDGRVTFDVVVFSRPADLLVRLGEPVARIVEGRVTDKYLKGVRLFAAGPDEGRGGAGAD